MKQLLQSMRHGQSEIVEVPIPTPQPGMVLVKTAASLVSVGTERMVVEFAKKSLVGKVQARPDQAKQVIDKARREGVLSAMEAAFNRLGQPMALGYSSAGTVAALGEGVTEFKVGERVVCAGGGYAVHAEYAVVPVNLMAPLPENVSFDSGAFGTLGAIAMHGFRLGQPQVGESVAVIGLGLLGLITVGIAQAAGCRVIGFDLDAQRVALAKQMGAEAYVRGQAEDAAQAFTEGQGVDVVLICADTPSDDPVNLAGAICRDRGRVVAVGNIGIDIPRNVYYYKEIDFIVSRSYGPGRYDPEYEEGGHDYPLGFVRWTAGRNLKAFVDLIGAGKLDISPLITHRFPIEQGAQAYELITAKDAEPFIGVVLTYAEEVDEDLQAGKTIVYADAPKPGSDRVQLGVLGAGNFAGAVILPITAKHADIDLVGIASASGRSAQHAARKFKFDYVTTDERKVIEDENVNTVAVLTRHHLHAPQVLAALRAGKHVFCEKPLALTQAELDEIAAEVAKPDAPLLMVGFNRRFAPLAVRMYDFMAGRPEPLAAHYRVNAGFIPPTHWVHDPAQGGGRLVGEACHFIDFITWLVGAPPSTMETHALPDSGRYRGDNAVLQLGFPDGSIGTVTYLANGDKSVPKERVEVFSGGRVAILDDYRRLETYARGSRKVYRSWLRQDKGHAAEWDTFAAAIKAGGPPPIPYEQLFGVSRLLVK